MAEIRVTRRQFLCDVGAVLTLGTGVLPGVAKSGPMESSPPPTVESSSEGLLVWVIVHFVQVSDREPTESDFRVTLKPGLADPMKLAFYAIAPNERAIFYGHFAPGSYLATAEAFAEGRTFSGKATVNVESGFQSSVQIVVAEGGS